MSVNATNSTKYMEFHGIKLAAGAAVANFIIEKLATDPLTLEAGRSWYNTTTNTYNSVISNGKDLEVISFATEAKLVAAITALETELASTVAGEGSGIVGFSGQAGTNGKYSVVAGTTEAALKSLVDAVDAEIKGREDADTAAAVALAAVTGSTLVGYEGKVGTNGKVTVAEGTVDSAIDSLVNQVDAALSTLGDDAVSKSTLTNQAIASKVTFASDVVIEGDISVLGERFIVEGNVVELGDNIILLNRDVTKETEPVADAGLEVNRGTKGALKFIIWDESGKQTVAPNVVVATEANIDLGIKIGDETVTMSRVVLGTEFDAFDTKVGGRLGTLENQVNGKIGELTNLVTEDKSTIVASINELHADSATDRTNLSAATGATLVGYAGKAGVNTLVTVAEGTVKASFDSLVDALDAEMKASDDYEAAVAASTGSTLVGFAGHGAVEDSFFVPAGTVDATLDSVVTAIKEDRGDIAKLQGASDALVNAINASKYVTVSPAALTHTIVHNLNSENITVDVWFKDGTSWLNHQASCKIVDTNNVEFTLSTAAELKVIVRKADDIVLA